MGSIYLREGSDVWYLRYRNAGGKLVRQSSGTTNEDLAKLALVSAEAKVAVTKAETASKTWGPKSKDTTQQRLTRLEEALRIQRQLMTALVEAHQTLLS